MKHTPTLLLIVLCVAFERMALAQAPTTKTPTLNQTEQNSAPHKHEGLITGRVIGPDGQPAPDAQVIIHQIGEKPAPRNWEATDDDGNFKLTGLSPGAYILFAQAPGYVAADVSTENAIHRTGENVTISLVKGGAITGRVTDEIGEPIVGVSVFSNRLRDLEGKTRGLGDESFGGRGGATDDRGVYRIYGLPPGVYIVGVAKGDANSPDDAQIRLDAPTYHPSATRDTAVEINLRSGEEVSGIDIRHRGVRGRMVSGKVSGEIESSSPARFLWVGLKGLVAGRFEAGSYVSDSRGFAIYGVPDDEYELMATRMGRDDEMSSSAPRRISVKGADVSGIELKLAPLASIAGRIVIEPSNPPKRCAINHDAAANQSSDQVREQTGRRPVLEEVTLRANRDEPNQLTQRSRFSWLDMYGRPPNAKGEFALKSLEAGRYRIVANLPDDGWRIRAITQSIAGTSRPSAVATGTAKSPVDASRNGIAIKPGEKLSGVEVIVADDAATLNGRVVPAKDGVKLPSSLRAHLIPAEAASADDVIRYDETDVRGDGSFEFKHIAPGRYLLHARRIAEKETNDDQVRPAAWDAIERAKLRREAINSKNEIELQACGRVKDYALRYNP